MFDKDFYAFMHTGFTLKDSGNAVVGKQSCLTPQTGEGVSGEEVDIMIMGEVTKPGSLVTSFQDVRESTGCTKPTFLPVLAEVMLWFFEGDFFVNHKCQTHKTT